MRAGNEFAAWRDFSMSSFASVRIVRLDRVVSGRAPSFGSMARAASCTGISPRASVCGVVVIAPTGRCRRRHVAQPAAASPHRADTGKPGYIFGHSDYIRLVRLLNRNT
jgi:hypothetical protein